MRFTSREKMRPMSSTATKASFRLPMQAMNSASQRRPMRGVASSDAAASSVTSFTLSARMPTVVGSPSIDHLDHHDARIAPRFLLSHRKQQPQVGEWHDTATHVDQPVHRMVRPWYRGDRHRIENLAHLVGFYGKALALQFQDQHHQRVVHSMCCHAG